MQLFESVCYNVNIVKDKTNCMLHVLVSWNLYHHVTGPLYWWCFFQDQKLHRDIYVEMDVTDRGQDDYNVDGYLDVPKGFNCSMHVHS